MYVYVFREYTNMKFIINGLKATKLTINSAIFAINTMKIYNKTAATPIWLSLLIKSGKCDDFCRGLYETAKVGCLMAKANK